jgi:hypothetical protein
MIGLVFALGWSLFSTTPQTLGVCEFLPPVVSVLVDRPQLRVDHSLSGHVLGQRLQKEAPGIATLGMAETDPVVSYQVVTTALPMSGARVCGNIQSVVIRLAHAEPPTIFIASEIPEGSCRYRSTLAHEEQHIGFSREATEAIAADLQGGLVPSITQSLPMQFASAEEIKQKGLEIVQAAVDPVVARHRASETLKNLGIDTTSSYQALAAECPGE